MYFSDFLTQYNRFRLGTILASSFATWLFRVSDDMADGLDHDEWDLFTDIENCAAELTGEHVSEPRFRQAVNDRVGDFLRVRGIGISENPINV